MDAKQPKCFVPDCYNSVGVLFPKNEAAKKNWLKALRLEHLEPDLKSFVCLDHFGKNGEPALNSKLVTPSSQMESQKVVSSKTSSYFNHESLNLCRLCMTQGLEVSEQIFKKLNEKYTIAEAIKLCIHPLKISPLDSLSKYICQTCLTHLTNYLEFYEKCISMDRKQRIIKTQRNNDSDNNDQDSDTEYLHEEWLTEYAEFQEKDTEATEKDHNSSAQKPPVQDKLSELINRTFKSQDDKDKEELLHVLEDESGETTHQLNGDKSRVRNDSDSDPFKDSETENIFIEMVNDDEANLTSPRKVPVTIRRIYNSAVKKRNSEDANGQLVKKSRLSESDDVEKTGTYKSPLGWFNSELYRFLFNSEYIVAGGYLYDMRLTKGDTRRLHCIVNKCPGVARQYKVNRLEFSHRIKVIVSHNHRIPDAHERKRQMFYDILYKKMRRDRFFNFKVLYEQFCKQDGSLINILPLSAVVQEICKQGPAPPSPSVNSFEDFYKRVDQDEFNKIHFTDNRAQFYRDKFETSDGGKAIAFGNEKVIRQYSYSKLMLVDASFYIEAQVFPYQLVTVFLWVEQSYYPVFYVLVNLKSQALYRRIFSYLHSEYPNLRPTEIVTEYEANLYYALSEVYVQSNVGGSIYYFAQNIYKKICSIGLGKALEVNTNFRNIYNMLLMLPLLPVNTIPDCLAGIEKQAEELDVEHLTINVFQHIKKEWIEKVTPEYFCIHRLENRINENIVSPMKKLRDLVLATKSKSARKQTPLSIVTTVEKLVDLDRFLRQIYSTSAKATFTKDISSNHKRSILKAWNHIENHPNINTNQFYLKVLGYIKCMENQLWIWGLYQFSGKFEEHLIDAKVFADDTNDNQEQEQQPALEIKQDRTNVMLQTNTKSTAVVPNISEEDDSEQTEVIEEYYVEDGGKIRKIQLRQPSNCSVQGFGDISEEDMEVEIFGEAIESFS